MGGSVSKLLGGLVLPFLALGACQSSKDTMDLAVNETLYRSPGYQVRLPADRVAYMPPVADQRTASAAEEAAGPNPVTWMREGYWDRPIVEMFDDVLRRELEESRVFADVQADARPGPESVIVKVALTRARAGLEEQPAKRRTIAEIAVEVEVSGPVDAHGGRDVIWRDEFREVAASEPTIRPPTVPSMFGNVTRRIVARVCAALDQSNVARSGVPIGAVGN